MVAWCHLTDVSREWVMADLFSIANVVIVMSHSSVYGIIFCTFCGYCLIVGGVVERDPQVRKKYKKALGFRKPTYEVDFVERNNFSVHGGNKSMSGGRQLFCTEAFSINDHSYFLLLLQHYSSSIRLPSILITDSYSGIWRSSLQELEC